MNWVFWVYGQSSTVLNVVNSEERARLRCQHGYLEGLGPRELLYTLSTAGVKAKTVAAIFTLQAA